MAASEWHAELFDCFDDMSLCCLAYFLPCVVYGRTQSRRKNPEDHGHSDCNGSCWAWAACCICCSTVDGMGCLQWHSRSSTREQYGIHGTALGDCAASMCCHCCALIQEEKDSLKRMGKLPQDQGYQFQQDGMAYRQQPVPSNVYKNGTMIEQQPAPPNMNGTEAMTGQQSAQQKVYSGP